MLLLKISLSFPQIKDIVQLKWATLENFPVALPLSGAVWDTAPLHTTLEEWQILCAHSLSGSDHVGPLAICPVGSA